MPVLTAGNTVYTHPVAKVMISIPDSLLERLDALAESGGETRSGLLQRLAETEIDRLEARESEEIGRLLDEIEVVPPPDLPAGSDVARLIREGREAH